MPVSRNDAIAFNEIRIGELPTGNINVYDKTAIHGSIVDPSPGIRAG